MTATTVADEVQLIREMQAYEEFCLQQAKMNFLRFVVGTMTTYKVDPAHRLLAERIDAVVEGRLKRLIIAMPPQHGKLVAHTTPVPTPTGWREHGDLRSGDCVFDREGHPTPVVAVSHDGLASRRVHFTDGGVVCVHPAHEWLVRCKGPHSNRDRLIETDAIAQAGTWMGKRRRGGGARFWLPGNVPLRGQDVRLPVPPYTLGAWLGDGTTTKGCITHAATDRQVVERIGQDGFEVSTVCVHRATGVETTYFRVLRGMLDAAGVLGVAKHIPAAYLTASRAQRLALLAGLVDTDGAVYAGNGRVTISTTSAALVEGVTKLCTSLGWRTSVTQYAPTLSSSGIHGRLAVYQIGFNPTEPIPVVLPRKQGWRQPVARGRGIVAVESCSSEPGRCIQVVGGNYLIGETAVPTHNSLLVSVHLPAYWLGRRPDDPVILCSYAASLAERHSRHARDVVEGPDYERIFPEVKTRRDTRAVGLWEIGQHRGYLVAAGVGGPITGHGALLGIIDDPFEHWEQAQSPVERETVWDWYRGTFLPRLWEDAAIVMISTRWHEDDLAGRILAQAQPGEWDVLRLPALGETQEERDKRNLTMALPSGLPDPLNRDLDAPLCPKRFSYEALDAKRREVGASAWEAEYMGSPVQPEGATFKAEWWRWYDTMPSRFDEVIQSWDMAFKGEQDSSFVVGEVWGRLGLDRYLLDVIRARMDFPASLAAMEAAAKKWPQASVKLVEDKANGPAVVASLRHRIGGLVLVKPEGGKRSRAVVAAAQTQSGHIWLPRLAPWVRDFTDECERFPRFPFDDQVDSFSQAMVRWEGTTWTDSLATATDADKARFEEDMALAEERDAERMRREFPDRLPATVATGW
jgi:predicted phage terminase large subunit-like protein